MCTWNDMATHSPRFPFGARAVVERFASSVMVCPRSLSGVAGFCQGSAFANLLIGANNKHSACGRGVT